LAENEKRAGEAGEKPCGDEHPARVAALRERRNEKRRGNAARWKAWKTQKASFPLFPPGLEIRQKTSTPDFHISTAPATGLHQHGRTKTEVQPDSS
jgi:hypothetical protein